MKRMKRMGSKRLAPAPLKGESQRQDGQLLSTQRFAADL